MPELDETEGVEGREGHQLTRSLRASSHPPPSSPSSHILRAEVKGLRRTKQKGRQ